MNSKAKPSAVLRGENAQTTHDKLRLGHRKAHHSVFTAILAALKVHHAIVEVL